jgi:hypothetical protein
MKRIRERMPRLIMDGEIKIYSALEDEELNRG